MPGEDATMQLRCKKYKVRKISKSHEQPGLIISLHLTRLLKPMVLEAGQHFTIRDHGGTIGTGKLGMFNSFSVLDKESLDLKVLVQ